MEFAYEAMSADGSVVADQVEAAGSAEAVEALRTRGLVVLRLEQGQADTSSSFASTLRLRTAKVTTRDLILFTRQMKMLLEAGAPLVPALEAIELQTAKPALREIIYRLRDRVEEGDSLSTALQPEGRVFDPVFRSMVAAGEATASLPQVFSRLSDLAAQQLRARKLVIGALLYPLILLILLIGVVCVLLFFVVPRFKMLFVSLRTPLPMSTKFMFGISAWLTHGWPYVVGGVVAAAVAATLCLRLPQARGQLDGFVLRLPLVGPLAGRLIFARVLRVWAAMLRCHVPLLDAIRQSREAITNAAFLRLVAELEETVASGGRVGQALSTARLADPIIVSAIRTGEDNGRLAEATEFVSNWMDEDNANTVQHITRLAEPVLLAVMGVVVGAVAMSLFVPLFDLATAAG